MSSSSSEFSSDSSDEELFNYLRRIRQPKIIKKRQNYFDELTESEFFDRFRLTKETVQTILQRIEPDLQFTSLRNECLTSMQQLLLTLRFFATGGMLISVGDFMGVTKCTASRTVYRVSQAIARLHSQFIKMPETENEIAETVAGFYAIGRFPKVIGTIDCTHIKIQSPGNDDGEIYRNRKGFFSYNVQTICNYNLKISNIVARWPGSSHDQTIFNNSRIKSKFDLPRYKNYYLLGDSGYKNTNYLLTPLLRTTDAAQDLYNNCHIKTRNTVERQYGVWKRRFPILSLGMRVSPELTKTIIVATAVLHNIAIDCNEPLPADTEIEMQAVGLDVDEIADDDNNSARHRLIYNYFNTLL